MKKILILISIIIVGVLAYLFNENKTVTKVSSDISTSTKVGFVYLTTPGDHGWTYAHELGKQQVENHFGKKVITTVVENVCEELDCYPGSTDPKQARKS